MSDENNFNAVELATELTIAWLGNRNNRIIADEVPEFLRNMHRTVTELAQGAGDDQPASAGGEQFEPAVSVRKSLASPDHILSMIDGKPYKSLRRHLTRHGLTPDEYRRRYNLKPDYPMVSRTYSEQRRAMAHKIGLGARRRAKAPANPTTVPAKKSRRAPRQG